MGVRFKAELERREKMLEEERKNLGNFKSLAQKKGLEKKQKSGNQRRLIKGEIKRKKVVKEFLKTNSLEETAKKVGISRVQATRYLHNEKSAKSIAEAFEKAGLGKDEIARIAKDEFLGYNKEKVLRSYGEGINAREVEEMRDGRLAFNALQFAAKYIEADANTVAQTGAGEVSSDIAMLAIKNLIQKLDEKQLRIVKESIEVLLEKEIKVVSSQ